MTTVTISNIETVLTKVHVIDRFAYSKAASLSTFNASNEVFIFQHDPSFSEVLGKSPTHSLLLSTSGSSEKPFFHEACVFLPEHQELYITSNLIESTNDSQVSTIFISRIKLHREDSSSEGNRLTGLEWVKLRPPTGIDMPNGGVNYENGILFCAQGTCERGTGGMYYMSRMETAPSPLVTNFHGRDFNSVNDVIVARDGAIWFTDPCYGYEQQFRQMPVLPNQVYRYDPKSGDLRVVADGFGRPNGLAFSPDESILYITDTDHIHGDGKKDLRRPAHIYAFDVLTSSGAPFLANRRMFAMAAEGFPDGIKCDVHGNVYSGCGDGVEVWNPAGSLLGRITIAGGCANFCFGKNGEMFICNEQKLWRVQLAPSTMGALLRV